MSDRQQLVAVEGEDGRVCCPKCIAEGKKGFLARKDKDGVKLFCDLHNADVLIPLQLRKMDAVDQILRTNQQALDFLATI